MSHSISPPSPCLPSIGPRGPLSPSFPPSSKQAWLRLLRPTMPMLPQSSAQATTLMSPSCSEETPKPSRVHNLPGAHLASLTSRHPHGHPELLAFQTRSQHRTVWAPRHPWTWPQVNRMWVIQMVLPQTSKPRSPFLTFSPCSDSHS